MPLPTQAFERALQRIQNCFPDFDYQPDSLLTMRMLRVLSTETSNYFNKILAKYEINDTMWYALTILYGQDGQILLPSELSKILDLTRTSATRLSDDLLKRGWVIREPSTVDRRSVNLLLSTKGKELVEELTPLLAQVRIELWSELEDSEIQLMNELLRRLIHRVKNLDYEL